MMLTIPESGLAAVAADSGGATGGIAGRTADPPSANERPNDRRVLLGLY